MLQRLVALVHRCNKTVIIGPWPVRLPLLAPSPFQTHQPFAPQIYVPTTNPQSSTERTNERANEADSPAWATRDAMEAIEELRLVRARGTIVALLLPGADNDDLPELEAWQRVRPKGP